MTEKEVHVWAYDMKMFGQMLMKMVGKWNSVYRNNVIFR